MPKITRYRFQASAEPPDPWKASGARGSEHSPVEIPFSVVRIQCLASQAVRKREVREVLDFELQSAIGFPVRWEETTKGPRVLDFIDDTQPSVSISYVDSEAWLGIGWRGAIGVDAVALREIEDWEEVALTYFDRQSFEILRQSTSPGLNFSREWAALEARLKFGGLSLEEGVQAPPAKLYEASFGTVIVAVAV